MDEPEPPPNDRDEVRRVRQRTLASKRACVITGVVASAIGAWINASSGASAGRTALGALFLGFFTGYGLWLVTRARTRIRPSRTDPQLRDPSSPPPAGGWANPTGGQKLIGKLRRALSGLSRRGPHR